MGLVKNYQTNIGISVSFHTEIIKNNELRVAVTFSFIEENDSYCCEDCGGSEYIYESRRVYFPVDMTDKCIVKKTDKITTKQEMTIEQEAIINALCMPDIIKYISSL